MEQKNKEEDKQSQIMLSDVDRNIVSNIIRGLAELSQEIRRLNIVISELTEKIPKH